MLRVALLSPYNVSWSPLSGGQLYGLDTHEEGLNGRLGGETSGFMVFGPSWEAMQVARTSSGRVELLVVCMSARSPRLINQLQSNDAITYYY